MCCSGWGRAQSKGQHTWLLVCWGLLVQLRPATGVLCIVLRIKALRALPPAIRLTFSLPMLPPPPCASQEPHRPRISAPLSRRAAAAGQRAECTPPARTPPPCERERRGPAHGPMTAHHATQHHPPDTFSPCCSGSARSCGMHFPPAAACWQFPAQPTASGARIGRPAGCSRLPPRTPARLHALLSLCKRYYRVFPSPPNPVLPLFQTHAAAPPHV